MDISNSIEKIRKENQKLKENLFTRRKDRINPNEFKGFSIVDLAVAFDNEKKLKLTEKTKILDKEEQEILDKRKDYLGNRYDVSDVKTSDEKEDYS